MPLTENDYQAAFRKIAEGKSVRNCITDLNCSAWMFYEGIKNNTKLSEQYAHARYCQAEASFEAILSAVNEVHTGKLDANAGRVVIDTYKWIAARLKPTVYADKTSLLGDANGNAPTELIVRWGKPKDIKTTDSIEIESKAIDS